MSLFLSYTNMNKMNSLHLMKEHPKISNFLKFENHSSNVFKVRAIWDLRDLYGNKIQELRFKKSWLITRVLKIPGNQPCLCARNLSDYVTQGREGVWAMRFCMTSLLNYNSQNALRHASAKQEVKKSFVKNLSHSDELALERLRQKVSRQL